MSALPEVMETDERSREIDDEDEEKELGEEHQEEDPEAEAEAEEEEEEEEEKNPQGEDRLIAESAESAEPKKSAPAKQKSEKREPIALVREPGKSLLPFSRVQKIIKADKDIPIVARDAVSVIALATESFIKELAAAAQRVADKERRMTVQHKDVATVVRKADEFMFLEDIIPWTTSSAEPKRSKPTGSKGKATEKPAKKPSGPTLDKFMKSNKEDDRTEGGMDVVMNEDGTMYATGETND